MKIKDILNLMTLLNKIILFLSLIILGFFICLLSQGFIEVNSSKDITFTILLLYLLFGSAYLDDILISEVYKK